jgi:hypothetical protein
MNRLEFQYKLTQEELEEALFDLDWRRYGFLGRVNLWILNIIGIMVMIGCIRHPQQPFLFILLALIIFMLLFMTEGARLARERKARHIMRQPGEYRIQINDTYITCGDGIEKIMLSDNRIQFLCSQNVCVIKSGREVFTIPTRIMTQVQFEELKKIAEKYNYSFIHIVLREERVWCKKPMKKQ